MADYTLPELPYDYGALEPHISGEIMELHHSQHHATYVKGANLALEQLAEAREHDALGTVKPDYVEAWWNVVNWADVAHRLSRARSMVLP